MVDQERSRNANRDASRSARRHAPPGGGLRDSRVFSFIFCIILFLMSFCIEFFGYWNNDWAVIKDAKEETVYRRGWNVDCFRNDSTTPTFTCSYWENMDEWEVATPFQLVNKPDFGWHLMLHFARLALLFPLAYAAISFAACCFPRAELALSQRVVMRNIFFGAAAHIALITLVIGYLLFRIWLDDLMRDYPRGYKMTIGFAPMQMVAFGGGIFVLADVIFFLPLFRAFFSGELLHEAVPSTEMVHPATWTRA